MAESADVDKGKGPKRENINVINPQQQHPKGGDVIAKFPSIDPDLKGTSTSAIFGHQTGTDEDIIVESYTTTIITGKMRAASSESVDQGADGESTINGSSDAREDGRSEHDAKPTSTGKDDDNGKQVATITDNGMGGIHDAPETSDLGSPALGPMTPVASSVGPEAHTSGAVNASENNTCRVSPTSFNFSSYGFMFGDHQEPVTGPSCPPNPLLQDFWDGSEDTESDVVGQQDTDVNADVAAYQVEDIYGQPATDDTPMNEFPSWSSFILFCEQGARVTMRFDTLESNGSVRRAVVVAPKKLLVDTSAYFRGAFGNQLFVEAASNTLTFCHDEIMPYLNAETFLRLLNVLRVGISDFPLAALGGGVGLLGYADSHGSSPTLFQDAVEVYSLADFFVMPAIKHIVARSIRAGLARLADAWPAELAADLMYRPARLELVRKHEARVGDLLRSLDQIRQLPFKSRMVDVMDWLPCLRDVCPRMLLWAVWEVASVETRAALGAAALFSP